MPKRKNWKSRIIGRGNTPAVRGRLVLTYVWMSGQLPVFIQTSSPLLAQQCLKPSADSHRLPKEKPNRRSHKAFGCTEFLNQVCKAVFPFQNIWQSWIIQTNVWTKDSAFQEMHLAGTKSQKTSLDLATRSQDLHITRLRDSCSGISWTSKGQEDSLAWHSTYPP